MIVLGFLTFNKQNMFPIYEGFIAAERSQLMTRCFVALASLKAPANANILIITYQYLLFIFERSQVVVLCKGHSRLLECTLTKEDGTYDSSNIISIETELGEGLTHSQGPNNVDVWQSGGISTSSWNLEKHIRIFKERPFSITLGPDLPMAMAGHCQVNLGNGTIFIYGGIISINTTYNSYTQTLDKAFEYSDKAWTGPDRHGKWTPANVTSPCPKQQILKELQHQQCSLKSSHIIIVNQNYDESCTSVFNIETSLWTKVESTTKLTLGGFMINGFDNSRVFYLSNQNVFEFINDWVLMSVMLPLHINQTTLLMARSQFNVTKCKADAAHWPTH